jgi:hypothetical protein
VFHPLKVNERFEETHCIHYQVEEKAKHDTRMKQTASSAEDGGEIFLRNLDYLAMDYAEFCP